MNKKSFHKLLLVIIFIIPIILFYFISERKNIKEEFYNKIHSEVYETNDGYGYKIISNNKVLIKQDFIPAISGNIPFDSYIDADNIAKLVIGRILSGQDPKVEKRDIDDLYITIRTKN